MIHLFKAIAALEMSFFKANAWATAEGLEFLMCTL